ncbi:MAG: hypothetical protein JW839_17290 [Candidatus Lokiarchaeota archaeon]|nr:hypothetical protein [Candidatus Lokiarchaeota archaeon]
MTSNSPYGREARRGIPGSLALLCHRYGMIPTERTITTSMNTSTRFPRVKHNSGAPSGKKPNKLMAGIDGMKNELPDETSSYSGGSSC